MSTQTIAAGRTARIDLSAGLALTLTGTGEAAVFADGRILQIAAARVIGPYETDTLVDVKAVTTCTATVGNASAGVGGSITSITYNGSGQVTDYTDSGVDTDILYNADGTVKTVTALGVTKTVSYNGDGTVATYQ